jgi:hypothetical protein
MDSLKADGREKDFVRLSQRNNALGFAAAAIGVPLAFLLVKYVSVSSTIIADGLIGLIGVVFAFRLVEAPRFNGGQEAIRLSAWHAMKQLAVNSEARWLVAFGSVLGASTYLAFWLSAPYYTQLGIPVVWFSVILAVRSIWKAWLSHRFVQEKNVQRNMVLYSSLAGLVYVAMASGQIWLAWIVLGHDVVQALQSQPIAARLNAHIDHEFRATMNSVVHLVQRLVYSIAGPLIGLLVDRTSLSVGFMTLGIVISLAALVSLLRLQQLKTFQENG